jgi:uncharacterized protein DUF3237
MDLERVMTYRCLTRGPLDVVHEGVSRRVWEVAEASLDGTDIHASLAAPGSDWMLVGDDGYWRPDVRVTFRTDDGATIALAYDGLVEQSDAFVAAAEADRETAWEDQYMRMALRFSTDAERYTWLSQSLFVARGRILGTGRVEYEVFRVS